MKMILLKISTLSEYKAGNLKAYFEDMPVVVIERLLHADPPLSYH